MSKVLARIRRFIACLFNRRSIKIDYVYHGEVVAIARFISRDLTAFYWETIIPYEAAVRSTQHPFLLPKENRPKYVRFDLSEPRSQTVMTMPSSVRVRSGSGVIVDRDGYLCPIDYTIPGMERVGTVLNCTRSEDGYVLSVHLNGE